MNRPLSFIFIISSLFLFSCSSGGKKYTDTPTSGDIIILADESYEPLVKVQIDTFMDIYKYANIHVRYLPESEVFKQLLNDDTVRLAIVTRELKVNEQTFFANRKIIPRTLKVAEDAVALIVNNENTDTLVKFEKLKDIFSGKIRTWENIGDSKSKDSILVVFDKSGSANARYLKEVFLGDTDFPKNIYAAKSNAEVVEYVSNHKAAIGVIGLNWISDHDAPSAIGFLKKIKVVALTPPDTVPDREYYQPIQAYIALKKYPLTRGVYIISKEGRNGLGTGFASFMAGDKGQRLIRLMGLLPATMPVRLVKINNE